MTILVIDVGTSTIRAAAISADGTVLADERRPCPPATPFPGLVEFDANEMAETAIDMATAVIEALGGVAAVGIANQRDSTIVWDPETGQPVGPGLGWQDLRTVGECLALQAEGLRLAPNQSATKLSHLLDEHDPDRDGGLVFGTVDTWLVWRLTHGGAHVTDATNAAITGLSELDRVRWDAALLERLRIPEAALPEIVPTIGEVGPAEALPGAPPIAGVIGDQQSSLIGLGCVRPGLAKLTFGTGGMIDVCVGRERPPFAARSPHGTFPIVAWGDGDGVMWGVEGIMLSAGSNVEWLCDDLGLIAEPSDSHAIAQRCASTDGVMYVPAPLGLGTPDWDYGARAALFGMTRGSEAPHVVRAVLEGVAQRGADLVEAVEADTGYRFASLRVDGGMSSNPTFTQALADAIQRPVELSPVVEGTSMGAALCAGLAIGTWSSWDDVAERWTPRAVVEPDGVLDRDRWRDARARAAAWYPELSALDF